MAEVDTMYKIDLARALTAIATERDKYDGTVDSTIQTKIQTDGGWVCDEATTWSTDVGLMCQNVQQKFQDAWDDVNAAHAAQPDKVDDENESEWRHTYTPINEAG